MKTTSPTMTQGAEHLILQWLVNEGHVMHSGDLKTAFLNGDADLDRTDENAIYMQPPKNAKIAHLQLISAHTQRNHRMNKQWTKRIPFRPNESEIQSDSHPI